MWCQCLFKSESGTTGPIDLSHDRWFRLAVQGSQHLLPIQVSVCRSSLTLLPDCPRILAGTSRAKLIPIDIRQYQPVQMVDNSAANLA
eukprot:1464575-Amphidinium_carterae.1